VLGHGCLKPSFEVTFLRLKSIISLLLLFISFLLCFLKTLVSVRFRLTEFFLYTFLCLSETVAKTVEGTRLGRFFVRRCSGALGVLRFLGFFIFL
jgi:hypothetical protein